MGRCSTAPAGSSGLAFAVDPGDTTTAYALTSDEVDAGLRTFLERGTADPVATGPCLVG